MRADLQVYENKLLPRVTERLSTVDKALEQSVAWQIVNVHLKMGHPGMSRHLVFAVENISTGDVQKIYCSPSLQISFSFQIKAPQSSPHSAPTLFACFPR